MSMGSCVVSRRQRGLSLVEIMVALLLGAVITVGIVQMFTANRTTYQVNMGQARLQENARFAMDFITASMRMAGYRGCSNRTSVVNVVDGPGNLVDQFDMSDAIFGYSGGAGGWTPALDTLPSDIDTAALAPGTDVLVMRTVLDEGLTFLDSSTDSAQSFVTLPEDCAGGGTCPGFAPGDVLMASDCLQTVIFVLTGTGSQGQPNQNRMLINHNAGAGGTAGLSNSSNPMTQMSSSFNDDASLFRIGSEVFFIAPGAGTNNQGDPVLALWRKRGREAPVELVEGIQGLTLLYGEDTSGDRVPNRYRPIHQVGNRDNIVTIRVSISATSVDAVADGDVLQRDFTKTVAIRNRI